jgi:hypothetical protein
MLNSLTTVPDTPRRVQLGIAELTCFPHRDSVVVIRGFLSFFVGNMAIQQNC